MRLSLARSEVQKKKVQESHEGKDSEEFTQGHPECNKVSQFTMLHSF